MGLAKNTKSAYNSIAREFFEFRATNKAAYNNYLEMPAMPAALGSVKRKRVLDIGCGPGFHSAALLRRGSVVYGIDYSKSMIKIAESHVKGAHFTIGSVYHMPYKSGFFDVAFASYAVEHFTRLEAAFKEIRRVLKKRGAFVFSIRNPFREVTHHIPGKPYYIRRFGNYFEEGMQSHIWFRGTKYETNIPFMHRTLQTYVRTAVKSGFEIADYIDAKPISALKKVDKHLYNSMRSMPELSLFKLIAA
ncbi:MAG: class I SAM-dependent methyltransferase [Candidatus Micrarchaeia archaeon]